jgi:uncharacterized Zn finger protein
MLLIMGTKLFSLTIAVPNIFSNMASKFQNQTIPIETAKTPESAVNLGVPEPNYFLLLHQEAIYVAKLLAGEMPSDIEDLFQEQGLSLFPRRRNDIKFECSCPDYGDPCKHAAAIYYLVAEGLDKDPFLLLHLRGRSRSAILKGIGSGETALLDDSSDEKPLPIEDFWLGLPEDLQITRPEKIEALALRQLGEAPLFLGSQLKAIYREVAESIEKRLGDA